MIVARELLGKLFVVGECTGRIVETEAYRPEDPASHSHRGETARNRVMFGEAGHLYVYFTYGMHHCANVVTGQRGEGSAVLIRALEPVDGVSLMRERRATARRTVDLTNGPGKVCQALALGIEHNGTDLVSSPTMWVADDGTPLPAGVCTSPRVGIRVGTDLHWRFFVKGNAYVGRTPRYSS